MSSPLPSFEISRLHMVCYHFTFPGCIRARARSESFLYLSRRLDPSRSSGGASLFTTFSLFTTNASVVQCQVRFCPVSIPHPTSPTILHFSILFHTFPEVWFGICGCSRGMKWRPSRRLTLFHTSWTPTYTKSHLWKSVKQNRTWTKSNLTELLTRKRCTVEYPI